MNEKIPEEEMPMFDIADGENIKLSDLKDQPLTATIKGCGMTKFKKPYVLLETVDLLSYRLILSCGNMAKLQQKYGRILDTAPITPLLFKAKDTGKQFNGHHVYKLEVE